MIAKSQDISYKIFYIKRRRGEKDEGKSHVNLGRPWFVKN